jgi:uncharacterized protein (DUF169 family)
MEMRPLDKEQLEKLVVKVNCVLELERKIVGIKFLFSKDAFAVEAAKGIQKKIPYCVLVKSAMSGRSLKATGEDLACIAGARALGLKEIDDVHRSGQTGRRLGLYRDLATAKKVRDGMSYCDHRAYGVAIKPLAAFTQEPDVVMVVTSPYNVMRIIQAYSFFYGIRTNFKMTGNQAVCSESTAYPYLSNDINVSLLCIGTRHRAGWKESELAVAFPFNRFERIAEGLMDTVNIMESNQKKKLIEQKLQQNPIDDFTLEYDHNYYDDL